MINFPQAEEPPETEVRVRVGPQWHPSPSYPRDPPRITAADGQGSSHDRPATPRVLASGWMMNGPQVDAFEREFATYVGSDCAVAVSSEAAGVELALRALRLPHGSRVLVSTLASPTVLQAILRAALRPVLLDVSEDTGMPTIDHLRDAARSSDHPMRALVVAHWGGDPSDVAALTEAAGLPARAVVEDAGQALGACFDGRPMGGAGSACFSFYSTANLPIGDGGMVTTDDSARAELLRRARANGTSPAAVRHVQKGHLGPHVLREGGLQSGLTEQSAADGRAHLLRLPAWQHRRQDLAHAYDERLAGIPGLTLPHRPDRGAGEHSWQRYHVRVARPRAERDALVRALATGGVGTGEAVLPLHQLDYFRELCELPATGLSGADRLVDQLVSLPLYPRLTNAAVDRVGEVMEANLGRAATDDGVAEGVSLGLDLN